jgi:hypothetical protein
MREVYRAFRENEFQMQVALKLVKRGVDPEFASTHLQREREILARARSSEHRAHHRRRHE